MLLHQQLRRLAANVTTVEENRFLLQHDGFTPSRGEEAWPLYAPHDKGSLLGNVWAFLRADR